MSRLYPFTLADFHPHDLVWGMQSAQLSAQAPEWARQCLEQGWPVVVRRDNRKPGLLPIGVRGMRRGQRWADWMPVDKVNRCVSPEAIRQLGSDSGASHTLSVIERMLDGMLWGITGSHAFEAITGVRVTRVTSDLDVLLRLPQRVAPAQASSWLKQLAGLPVRADIQVESGQGGFSLQDWATNPDKVLLKTSTGAVITNNPWQAGGVA